MATNYDSDPETYAQMVVPFPTTKEAEENIQDFYEAVRELRKKHKIANVSCVVRDAIKDSGPFLWSFHLGDELQEEAMAAWHMGIAAGNRQDAIQRAAEMGLEGVITKAGKRKSKD